MVERVFQHLARVPALAPTRSGVATFAIAFALFALAWQTHIGWFYLADSLAWALLLVNLPLSWINLRGLRAQRRVVTRRGGTWVGIFEDDTISLAIEVHNRSFLPKHFFVLREDCPLAAPGEESRGFLVGTLLPRGRVTAAYNVRCHRRGAYVFQPLRLQSSAPFGLFRARRTIDAPLEVTVYPQVLPMGATIDQGPLHGRAPYISLPRPTGEFRGTREYQQGDRPHSIHWRNSARRGQLMVKEFDQLPHGEVCLGFNPRLDIGEGRDTTLEYGIKIAASLAHRCFQEGRPFRMWPSGRQGAFSTWYGVLEHLARLERSEEPSINEMLSYRRPPDTWAVVVSAADNETLQMLQGQWHGVERTTVVLLEGFGPGEDSAANDVLLSMGAAVVRCRPGDLPAALVSLGRAMAAGPAAKLALLQTGPVSYPAAEERGV